MIRFAYTNYSNSYRLDRTPQCIDLRYHVYAMIWQYNCIVKAQLLYYSRFTYAYNVYNAAIENNLNHVGRLTAKTQETLLDSFRESSPYLILGCIHVVIA